MMINFSKRTKVHMTAWAACLVLTGCFSSDDDPVAPVAPTVVSPLVAIPATATASIMGLIHYQSSLNFLPQAEQDKAEPIDISSLTLPSSDTTEPFEV